MDSRHTGAGTAGILVAVAAFLLLDSVLRPYASGTTFGLALLALLAGATVYAAFLLVLSR